MSNVKALHEKWMNKPAYNESYRSQAGEFLNHERKMHVTTEYLNEEAIIPPLPLTPREQSVADLLLQGLEQNQIAERLYFSPAYIYEIMRRMRGKYCANNTYHLIVKLAEERYFKN